MIKIETYRPVNPNIANEVDIELAKIGINSRMNLSKKDKKIVDKIAHKIWKKNR